MSRLLINALLCMCAAYQPFCNLKCKIDVLRTEQSKLCTLAQACESQGTDIANRWIGAPGIHELSPFVPTIRELNDLKKALQKLESAINTAEDKLNSRVSQLAKEREEAQKWDFPSYDECGCFIATAAYMVPL